MDTASVLIIINIIVTMVAGPIALGIRDTMNRIKHSKCGCCDIELAKAVQESESQEGKIGK